MNFPAKLVFSMLMGFLALLPASAFAGPVEDALSSFERLAGYRVTLRSNSGEVIKYSFKKPGYIRMEFEKPHRGAVLVYDPFRKEVRLRPFGFLKSLELRMGPGDRLIRSSKGHTVDESDIGSLLRRVKKLKDNGTVETAGEEEVGGRDTIIVEVRGEGGVATGGVNRYRLWLEKTLMLPLKVEAYAASGQLLEGVLMDDLEVDPVLSKDLFSF